MNVERSSGPARWRRSRTTDGNVIDPPIVAMMLSVSRPISPDILSHDPDIMLRIAWKGNDLS